MTPLHELLALLVAEFRIAATEDIAAGIASRFADDADAIERSALPVCSDITRSETAFDAAEHISMVGRRIYLWTACKWIGRAYAAMHGGLDLAVADWTYKAGVELARYRVETK
jgi:hypothetical protein